jgi:predicted MFS family arabinose efflux permease
MTRRFFHGWVVLAAAFVIITMSIGTLFTLGVFLRPIEESMGWSRSGTGAIGLAPLTRWLINEFDWRVAFLVPGNLAWVVVLPTALLLRPPGGEPARILPSSSSSLSNAGAQKWPPHSPGGGQPFPAPWASWPFWAIALTHFCCCAAHSGPLSYVIVTRESYGERVLGTAYGGVFFISCIGMGLGSYAGGAIHDLLGTYQWLFLGSFAIGMMAIVLGMTLRAPVAVPGPRPSPAMGA